MLQKVEGKIKRVPNLYKALAHSPAALDGYLQLAETLSRGVLPTRTRESLAVAIAEANRCEYCLSAHVAIGKQAGLSDKAISHARRSEADDPKLDAILRLARKMVTRRGQVDATDVDAARQAGVSEPELAEIAAHIGMHTFSNYFNNLVQTEIDFPHVRLSSVSG
jgi:uncharacterized peroxidase-related enzyme